MVVHRDRKRGPAFAGNVPASCEDAGLKGVGDVPVHVTVVGGPPLALKPNGEPVNFKALLILPKDCLLPSAVLSSSHGTHGASFNNAMPAIKRLRRGAGMLQMEDDTLVEALMKSGTYVPLVVSGRGEGATLSIRPDTLGFKVYRQALDALTGPYVRVPPDKIKFMGIMNAGVRDMLKCNGFMHMVDPVGLEWEAVLQHLRDSERESVTGNRFFASERVSYMSASQLAGVLGDLKNRDRFQSRLEEIVSMYDEVPMPSCRDTGENARRQLDFLMVAKDGKLIEDTGFIRDALGEIAVDAGKAGDWKTLQKGVRVKFEGLLDDIRGGNNPLFNDTSLDTIPSDAGNRLYAIVRNIPTEEDRLKLGTEFRGNIKPLPGGYIPGTEAGGEYSSGLRVDLTSLPAATRSLLLERKAMLRKKGFVVVGPDECRGECESTQTFFVDGSDTVLWRRWAFNERSGPTTKDLINDMLADHPDLKYGYVCSVPVSRSRRDMIADDIRNYGEPDRDVNILVCGTKDQPETKMVDRVFKWNAQTFLRNGFTMDRALATAREYELYVLDRIACIQSLCPESGLPDYEIYPTKKEVPGNGTVSVSHVVRRYVDGDATNRLSLEQYQSADFVRGLVGCKGRMAASNMAVGRVLFDDGDEVVSSMDSNKVPTAISLIDPTSSFKDSDTPLEDSRSAGLYACSLASDLLKHRIAAGHAGKTVNTPAETFESLAPVFCNAVAEGLNGIKRRYRSERSYFGSIVDKRVKSDLKDAAKRNDSPTIAARMNPSFQGGNMTAQWPAVLSRLEKTDAALTAQSIGTLAKRVYETGLGVIDGLQYPEQANVVELYGKTLSMNSKSIGPILDVIEGDAGFNSLGFADRMTRINAVRISTWMLRTHHNPAEVRGYAAKCMSGRGAEDARAKFLDSVNQEFPMMHLSGEMAGSFFDIARDPRLADELERKGYMLTFGSS
ncbi:MAG: hypothetical protein PHG85_06310 [Candidatus Altiarchaeota archaeon]|nr:hypothetical protein [Candidatus Altiarchaeota archaeon]